MELRAAVEYLQKAKKLAKELQETACFYEMAAEKVRACQPDVLAGSMDLFVKINDGTNEIFRYVQMVADAHEKPMPSWATHDEFVQIVDGLSNELSEKSLVKCRAWYLALSGHLGRGSFVNKTTGKAMTAYERLRMDAINQLSLVSDGYCIPVEGPILPEDWLVWIWSQPENAEKRLEPLSSWATSLCEMLLGTDQSQWVLDKGKPEVIPEDLHPKAGFAVGTQVLGNVETKPSSQSDPPSVETILGPLEILGETQILEVENNVGTSLELNGPGTGDQTMTPPQPDGDIPNEKETEASCKIVGAKSVKTARPAGPQAKKDLSNIFNPWGKTKDRNRVGSAKKNDHATSLSDFGKATGSDESKDANNPDPPVYPLSDESKEMASPESTFEPDHPVKGAEIAPSWKLPNRNEVEQLLLEVACQGDYLRAALLAGALELDGMEKPDPRVDGLITAHHVYTGERCQNWPLWCYNPDESAAMVTEFPETAKLVLVASLCQARNEHGVRPIPGSLTDSLLNAFNIQPDIRSCLDEYLEIVSVPGLWEQICQHSTTDPNRDYREARNAFHKLYDNSLCNKTSNVAYIHRLEHFIARQPEISRLSSILKVEKPGNSNTGDAEAIPRFLHRKPESIFDDWLETTKGMSGTANLKGNQRHEIVRTAYKFLQIGMAAWNAAKNLHSMRAPNQDVEQRARALRSKANRALGLAKSATFGPMLDKLLEGLIQ